ncbi:hypothetical protein JCM6882_009524 [Rhodosporidiobolus microsporus]
MLPVELRHLMLPVLRRGFATSASSRKPLVVLGLESSADDTCAAIVDSSRRILSNVVLKQSSIHESFGGIHPLHAQEAHQLNMPIAIQRALAEADVSLSDLNGIAFTRGPGMYGCLSVCAGAAKALAAATGKPLLGVHHMQAHALTPFLTAAPNSPYPTPQFPFLTLLLSGGHTLLLHASSPSSFRILATTHDESIGACLDKASRDLGVDWALGGGSPGAALEKFAFPSLSLAGEAEAPAGDADPSFKVPAFPTPFPRQLAFSYAGLRSSLTRILSPNAPSTSPDPPPAAPDLSEGSKRLLARSFMLAAFKQIEDKVAMALRQAEQRGEERVKGLVVSGGVASNLILRERLRITLDSLDYSDLPLIFPPPKYCTDNAAMIAHVGVQRLLAGRTDPLTVMQRSKWSVEECEADFERVEGAEGKKLEG